MGFCYFSCTLHVVSILISNFGCILKLAASVVPSKYHDSVCLKVQIVNCIEKILSCLEVDGWKCNKLFIILVDKEEKENTCSLSLYYSN